MHAVAFQLGLKEIALGVGSCTAAAELALCVPHCTAVALRSHFLAEHFQDAPFVLRLFLGSLSIEFEGLWWQG